MKEDSLKNKVIVVTGSGSGLGKVMSTYFLELSAHFIITFRNFEKLEKVKVKLDEKNRRKSTSNTI